MPFTGRPMSLWRLPSLALGRGTPSAKRRSNFPRFRIPPISEPFGRCCRRPIGAKWGRKIRAYFERFSGRKESRRLTAFQRPKISGRLTPHSTRRHFPLSSSTRRRKPKKQAQTAAAGAERGQGRLIWQAAGPGAMPARQAMRGRKEGGRKHQAEDDRRGLPEQRSRQRQPGSPRRMPV